MYGRKYMGVVRTTYLIGPDGKVRHRWDKVSVPGHAAEVLAAIDGSPAKPAKPAATVKKAVKVTKAAAGKVAKASAARKKVAKAPRPASRKPRG